MNRLNVSPRRRSGVTLIEVLVAIFVMSIGLLCVLTLFVLGAQRMGLAFKDSNATQAVINARAYATIKNLRGDPTVTASLQGAEDGPSTPVFVDPLGAVAGGSMGTIPRVTPSYFDSASPKSRQFFSLLDDVNFQRGTGAPKMFGSSIEREVIYTWAYLVQRQLKSDPGMTNAMACVFQRRPKAGSLETVLSGLYDPSASTITIASGGSNIVPGMWVLDPGKTPVGGKQILANFYRVTGVRDNGGGVTLDLQSSIQGYTAATTSDVIVLEGLVEVFDLGVGR